MYARRHLRNRINCCKHELYKAQVRIKVCTNLHTISHNTKHNVDNVYNLNPAYNVKKTPGTRRQVDVQANTAILTQLVAHLELSKVSLRKETPLVQLIDRPILPLEKDKVGRLKSLILGGFLAGFLTVLYLVFRQFYKKMVA
jgi:hypothetical protein